MPDEVAAWKAQQRTAMATQLQLEEESLARLEAVAAAKAAEGGDASVHGIRQGIGSLMEEDEDEKVFDAPGLVKVSCCPCYTCRVQQQLSPASKGTRASSSRSKNSSTSYDLLTSSEYMATALRQL
jgi:hypothetical protein